MNERTTLPFRGEANRNLEDGNTVASGMGGEGQGPEVLPCSSQKRDLGDADFIGFANVLAQA